MIAINQELMEVYNSYGESHVKRWCIMNTYNWGNAIFQYPNLVNVDGERIAFSIHERNKSHISASLFP